MIFLLALLPATMLTIAGYFVLYVSSRSEGTLRSFGKYLGFWAFTLAGLVVLCALFATAHHHHRMGDWRGMHSHMYGPRPMQPNEPGAAVAPAAPAHAPPP